MNPLPAPEQYFVIAGPTGSGKSALAMEIAARVPAEIVGADAFQIYRELPILTAQPPPADRARVPHHLVGSVPASECFDAGAWLAAAAAAIRAIRERGRTPLVVGGTGLYLRALGGGFDELPPVRPNLRAELSALELPALIERLRLADPDALARVDLANPRRVARAIEICETSGRALSEFRTRPAPALRGIRIERARPDLVARIDANVRGMFERGVEREVAAAAAAGVGETAANAIGFRDICALAEGRVGRDECVRRVAAATRQYAKRQLTWFRNQTTLSPLELDGLTPTQTLVERALAALDLE